MSPSKITRRAAIKVSATACGVRLLPIKRVFAAAANSRPQLALIGAGWQPEQKRQGRGIAIGKQAAALGDIVTIGEVDRVAAAFAQEVIRQAHEPHVKLTPSIESDYRRILDRDDIDAVLIGAPDHWHAKMSIEAMRAGKDVYCEKPVAVTVEEGQRIRDVVRETGRIFQVGTQQRTEYDHRFLRAIALVRQGRIGNLQRITVGLGPGWEGGPFPTQAAPPHLDWNQWLGPAPMTPYIHQRTHRTFRWWYEYAGGNLTDWGAHHVDIAQWAMGMHDSGPLRVESSGRMNQPLVAGHPTRSDTYNTAIEYNVSCQFEGGVEILIDHGRNGITFAGDSGRFFVNRGTLEGTPVDRLADDPLPQDAIADLLGREPPTSHMDDFITCLGTRQQPISDIQSHHRILTTCHLANLSLRLGRAIRWDAQVEQVIGDDQATALLSRNYRKGFEIEA